MRDAREWAEEINAGYEYTDSITLSVLIQRIQSDAARSERERAARVALAMSRIPHDAKNPTRDMVVVTGERIADAIRALPDANTDSAGEGEA